MKSSRSSARLVSVALATAVATVVPLAGVSAPASVGAAGKAAVSSKADRSETVPGRYIVMMKAAPLARYTGGMKGLPRTKPLAGHKIDVRSAAAKKYKAHLLSSHRSVLGKAGISARSIANNYSVAFNGFSAKLTKTQAAKLAQTGGVARVWPVEVRTSDTVSTPTFLGLEGPDGVWKKQFGGSAKAGRGIIVADLDSGIWPESHSFDALTSTPDQATINSHWKGVCDVGVEEPIACNNKLIGARYYGTPFGNDISDDFNSPRDFNGHGTHTASTAAGDHGVPVTINGIALGDASGMAPAARIAVYKVLWEDAAAANASGTTEGIVAAIDDAVADGADVINYSISGSSTFIVSPDELAFLGAADAGVFVSASAGNSGPGASTVAHNAPWEMTVAADTHDRGAIKTVTLGNGATYTGAGYGPGVGPAPVVNSPDAALPNADPTKVNLCYSASGNGGVAVLDPAKVAGKIVVCTRGVNARVDKSLAVKEAGGVGMILADSGVGITADFHSVPSIHINLADGTAVKAYVAGTANPTATISAQDSSPVEAPAIAGFSSRGPALAGGGDLLKPDIAAPGVGVFAAVAPPGNGGENFQSYDGTSMAAPHITGIAALIKQKHPTWSPMWIKSAIMTTASQLTNRNNPIQGAAGNATPFEMGAGHVRPAPAFDPGLVYDSGYLDWLAYGCSIGQIQLVAGFCGQLPAIDPSDFNSPSIAIGALPGSADGHPDGHQRGGQRVQVRRSGPGASGHHGPGQHVRVPHASGPDPDLLPEDHPDDRAVERVHVRLDHLERQQGPLGAQPDRGASGGGGGAVAGDRQRHLGLEGDRGAAGLHRHAEGDRQRSRPGDGQHHGRYRQGRSGGRAGHHPARDDVRQVRDVRRGLRAEHGHRPAREEQRGHHGRVQRRGDVRGGRQPHQPGGRQLHRRSDLLRRRHVHPRDEAEQLPAGDGSCREHDRDARVAGGHPRQHGHGHRGLVRVAGEHPLPRCGELRRRDEPAGSHHRQRPAVR